MNAQEAYRTSREKLGKKVLFSAPAIKHYQTEEFSNTAKPIFIPVSVTGDSCALCCKHCNRKLLKFMVPAQTPEKLLHTALRLKEKGCKGLLVSGGADRTGKVPIEPFAPVIMRIKQELDFKVAVHTGIVDESLADALSEAAVDCAMLDIIGADETIKSVYGLSATVEDYTASLSNVVGRGIAVAPHIVIGLDYGRLVGERRAIEIIAGFNLFCAVFVVIMPLAGTAMSDIRPPTPEEIQELLIYARSLMPDTPILLGCARPGGLHQYQTDRLALEAGVNGIAYPDEGIITLARDMGLEPRFSQYCCALLIED